MPYYQSNTLKHALCSSSSPLRRSGGEVLERICSKLGGGLERAIVPVDSPVVAIEGPYSHRAGELQDMVLRNIDCANLSAEYSLIDSHFSIIDDLKTANNQETDLYFYHSDHLGSSSFITDADGIVSQHLQYLPYGELFAEQRDNTARYYTPYKFSGKEKDEETGYSYFGARYYMPELSIWSAVDPMADDFTDLSPYNYCENNPVVLKDPDGNSAGVWDQIVGATYGFVDNVAGTNLRATYTPDNADDYNRALTNADVTCLVGGIAETSFGAGLIAAGVVAAPETGGSSLSLSATGTVVSAHGLQMTKNSATNLAKGNNYGQAKETKEGRPGKTITKENGVTVKTHGTNDAHKPAHAHVEGGGKKTRIGQNSKPLKGQPELTPKQKAVVQRHKSEIRRELKKVGRESQRMESVRSNQQQQ